MARVNRSPPQPLLLPKELWTNIIIPLLDPRLVGSLARLNKYFHLFIKSDCLSYWNSQVQKCVSLYKLQIPPGYNMEMYFPFYKNISVSLIYRKTRYAFLESRKYPKSGKPVLSDSYNSTFITNRSGTIFIFHGGSLPEGKMKPLPLKKCFTKIKIGLFGGGGIGCKTALAVRFLRGTFFEKYDPTIEDSYRLSVECNGTACEVDLLDTAGQEDFAPLRSEWLRSRDVYMVGFCVDSRSSFEAAAATYMPLVTRRMEAEGHYKPTILIGNKIDVGTDRRQVSVSEGVELARSSGCCAYVEMSVKQNVNCTEAFEILIAEKLSRRCPKLIPLSADLEKQDVKKFYRQSDLSNPTFGFQKSSALEWAVWMRDVDFVREILLHCTDAVVHWRNADGETPLHLACKPNPDLDAERSRQRVQIVRLLLVRGADPLSVSFLARSTPLTLAQMHKEILELLRAHLPYVNGASTSWESSPSVGRRSSGDRKLFMLSSAPPPSTVSPSSPSSSVLSHVPSTKALSSSVK